MRENWEGAPSDHNAGLTIEKETGKERPFWMEESWTSSTAEQFR